MRSGTLVTFHLVYLFKIHIETPARTLAACVDAQTGDLLFRKDVTRYAI